MKLTVVGCAAAWTRRPGRASSCYLVEHEGRAVVFDLGQGSFAELSRYLDPAALSAVLVSHLHPDHYIDLAPLRHYLKYEARRDLSSLEVHGPHELGGRLDGLFAETGFLDQMDVHSLAPGRFRAGGLSIEAGSVTHIPDSFAFRVGPGAGPALVYSGDCGRADDLLPLIQPTDVLLCEAAHGAGPADSPIHLTSAEAARVASRGGVRQLVLTHLLDRSDAVAALEAARAEYPGDVLLAEPGLHLAVG